MRSKTVERLPRPDGSVLQVEFFDITTQPVSSDRMKAELPYSQKVTIKPWRRWNSTNSLLKLRASFATGAHNSTSSL
jgi:hypothetical protein